MLLFTLDGAMTPPPLLGKSPKLSHIFYFAASLIVILVVVGHYECQ